MKFESILDLDDVGAFNGHPAAGAIEEKWDKRLGGFSAGSGK